VLAFVACQQTPARIALVGLVDFLLPFLLLVLTAPAACPSYAAMTFGIGN
jgi:hypothetical protein